MRNLRNALALFVVFAMLLTACGSGDGESAETTEATSATTAAASDDGATTTAAPSDDEPMDEPMEEVTLRVLVHQNPPFTDFMETFNSDFEAAHPGVTVEMEIVAPGDLNTAIQTRLNANDVDVIDFCCSGFSNSLQPYMTSGDIPSWQTLIEAGLLLDITDEAFVQNYDEASIQDASSFNGRVYGVNLGRVSYSGMFVNTDLLAANSVDIPDTWDGLVAACDTITASGNSCMTLGGADGWPIFVGAYGLLGSLYPDQEGLVEGLWTGDVKWNDAQGVELFTRYQIFATEMLESGVTGLGHNEATARYAAGDVAFMPTGVWQASVLEEAEPAFDWTYVPFPGSDDAADNQYLFGKYDQSWSIAANSPNTEAALAYVAAFSEPDNYNAFVNAVSFIPTQPTASLDNKLGQAVAPYLANYRVGFEQFWVQPSGAGQWANASQGAAWFAPFNEWTDATELANQAQADLEAAFGG